MNIERQFSFSLKLSYVLIEYEIFMNETIIVFKRVYTIHIMLELLFSSYLIFCLHSRDKNIQIS